MYTLPNSAWNRVMINDNIMSTCLGMVQRSYTMNHHNSLVPLPRIFGSTTPPVPMAYQSDLLQPPLKPHFLLEPKSGLACHAGTGRSPP